MSERSTETVAEVRIRVNGRGNAWPLELGSTDRRAPEIAGDLAEYANTSMSVVGLAGGENSGSLWEVLFDVGQGVVPFLIREGARLPDALILSHPHFDHTCGLDWLVNSHRHAQTRAGTTRKLPVYASEPCWQVVSRTFPWLLEWLEFRALHPGVTRSLDEAGGLRVTAFPVGHAEHSPGSIMALLEYGERDKAVLTGDVIVPLLRRCDVDRLRGTRLVIADSTVRFPWPGCGHWSVTASDPAGGPADALEVWRLGKDARYYVDWYLGVARRRAGTMPAVATDIAAPDAYLDEFVAEFDGGGDACWSVIDLVARIDARSAALVHYSGRGDDRRYGEPVLTDAELHAWVSATAAARASASWHVPRPGDSFELWRSS